MRIVTKFFSFIVLIAISSLFINYSSGQPDSLAGAPGDGLCTDCHGGSPVGSSITLSGTPTSYTPGQSVHKPSPGAAAKLSG